MSTDALAPAAPVDVRTAAAAREDRELSARSILDSIQGLRLMRGSRYGLTPFIAMSLIGFFQQFDSAAWDLAGPDVARGLNISINDIIGIQTMVGTVAIFAAIGVGWLADRTRRVPFFTVGTLVSGIFSAATGRGRSFAGVAAPRVIDDAANVAADIPSLSLFADYYPDNLRGRVIALSSNLGRAGALIAPPVAGWAIARYGWGNSFVAFGLPLVALGLVMIFLLREPVRGYWERRASGLSEEEALEEDEPQSFGEAWRATLAVRTIRRSTLAAVFTTASSGILGLFLPFFLAERYGLDAFERATIFVPATVVGIAGGLIGGAVVDRLSAINPTRTLIVVGVASLLLTPVPLLYLAQPPLGVMVLLACLEAFAFAIVGPTISVIQLRVIPPAIRTQGLQMTGLAALPTTIVFLPIARQIFSTNDYEGVFWFTMPLAVIGGLVAITAASFYELDVRSAFAQATAAERYRRQKEVGITKMLLVKDLSVHYGDVQVLFDVDLEVEEGEIIALLGTNGAGKSTLLRAMCGSAPTSSGGVIFDGRDITHMPPHEIAARGVVQMPGGKGVFPGLTVRDNLLLATWLLEESENPTARVSEILDIFPSLRGLLDVEAGNLSGGQQQQLSLAQAMMARPKLLLIDELSLGLAPVVVGQLIDVVKEINRRGVTIVIVEQSVNVALTIADRAVFMEKGEVRFDGPTADLLARPDILRAIYVKGTGALTAGGAAPSLRRGTGAARPILEVEGLVKHFGGVTAVDDVTFALPDGDVLGMIGPNGAGKTTIFELISGHQAPDAGSIHYDGVDITRLSPDARARHGLIRRFQDARLFPSLTVHETLLVSLDRKLEVRSTILGAIGAPQVRRTERRVRARADRLIELLELGDHRDKFVRDLSTGLRRVVDLACVLAMEPRLLLLDEPSSGIAQAEAEGLAPLLRRVKFETGCSILIIEHDMPLISSVSDELIAFDQGHVVTRGTPDEVLNHPAVIESYLGTSEAAVNRSGASR